MGDALTRSIPRSVWHGWGDPTQAHPLPAAAWAQLELRLGVAPQPTPRRPVPLGQVRLPTFVLPDVAKADLTAAVGAEHVLDDHESRVLRAGGKGWPDMYRLWAGDGSAAPDAVVVPADAAQVAAVLAVCVRHRIAVVPYGGGTSVVGGLTCADVARSTYAATISLDLRRLDRMLSCDTVSRVAVFQPGLRGPDIEAALRPYGLTFGHYPQSHQEATLGGYLATRSAGQASTGYGRPDEHVLGLRMATPAGELTLEARAPASAAGPKLAELVLGSEGSFGVITEASVRVQPMPTHKRHGAWLFGSYDEGCRAVRALAQDLGKGIIADVCRLSDEDETAVNLGHAGRVGAGILRYAALRGLPRPSLLVLVWEGANAKAGKARAGACEAVLARCDGVKLPGAVAVAWERHRFDGPYSRDELLGHHVLADTLETATTWDNLTVLHAAVAAAIRGALEVDGRRAVVMCHVSHVYAAGASLYYTFLAPQALDPLAQWQAVKDAAGAAIIAHGGTITHHHSVGRDHRRWMGAELGGLAVRMLRAVKDELDPTGIMNPGVLLPELSDSAGVGGSTGSGKGTGVSGSTQAGATQAGATRVGATQASATRAGATREGQP